MLTRDMLCPAELPPPKRRLTAPKPERIRYKGKAYKKLAPSDRTLSSERAKLLPLIPRAAKSPELQRIGTSSVYKRGDVKRSDSRSIVRYIGGAKGYGWRKRAAKRGWIQAQTLESAILGAKAVGGVVTECHSRRAVGAPLEASYWFRPLSAQALKRSERNASPRLHDAPKPPREYRVAQGPKRKVKTLVDAPKRLRV